MSKPKGKTLADFRALHDRSVIIPNKIRAALAQMETEGGPENWEYEGELVRRAGIAQCDISMFRHLFEAHIVDTPETARQHKKRVWVASAKAAVKFRGE
jgi:hypothetical protein